MTVPAAVRPGAVYWITGLSGAGKTTIANLLAPALRARGRIVVQLDGDRVRAVLGTLGQGHGRADRERLAWVYARLCGEIASQGPDVICATMSMFHAIRDWNRAHLPDYREIYLRVPVDVLVTRDTKGVYAAMRDVAGADQTADLPTAPDLIFDNLPPMTPQIVVETILAHWND